ncbi:hypothetical protein LINGRAHAP2_LOCUS22337 [Linum grandiflorum]
MIIMSWNCRGMGEPREVQVLGELIKTHRSEIVILLETFENKVARMETIMSKLKMGRGCFAVDVERHSGRGCAVEGGGGGEGYMGWQMAAHIPEPVQPTEEPGETGDIGATMQLHRVPIRPKPAERRSHQATKMVPL